MKGFELKHKNRTIVASIKNGVTSIFLYKKEGQIHLDFRGLDNDTQQHVTWFESIVDEGDEIRIKVVNTEKIADIIYAVPQHRDALQDKLVEYNSIKNYLEREGII